MPRKTSDPVSRIQVLALALDEATSADRWDEVHELLFQRQATIDDLSERDLSHDEQSKLAAVVEIDRRTIDGMERRKRELCLEIRARIGGLIGGLFVSDRVLSRRRLIGGSDMADFGIKRDLHLEQRAQNRQQRGLFWSCCRLFPI